MKPKREMSELEQDDYDKVCNVMTLYGDDMYCDGLMHGFCVGSLVGAFLFASYLVYTVH
jgi:hypothetical protein